MIEGRTIENVAEELLKAIEGKNAYNDLREELFDLIDQEAINLPEQTLTCDPSIPDESILREFPDYEIVNRKSGKNEDTVRLRLLPRMTPYILPLEDDEVTLVRSVSNPKPVLDLQEFYEEYPQYHDCVRTTYTVDGKTVESILEQMPDLVDQFQLTQLALDENQVNEISGDDPEITTALELCTYPVKPTVSIRSRKFDPENDL